LIVKHWWETY
jgi:hypothetical protein